MRKLKEEDIMPLWNDIQEFMKFLRQPDQQEIPYFYHFLEYMEDNIEIYLYTKENDLETLTEILDSNWRAAREAFLDRGICDLQRQDWKEGEQIYRGLCRLSERIGAYFVS